MRALCLLASLWAAYVIVASSDGAEMILDFLFLFYGAMSLSLAWLVATAYGVWDVKRRTEYIRDGWSYVLPGILIGAILRFRPMWCCVQSRW
jgi:hypothetical protein